VPEGKLCKSWRRVGERCLAVMSDYAAVEMEQDEKKGFRPDCGTTLTYRRTSDSQTCVQFQNLCDSDIFYIYIFFLLFT
jgi:hypothetical protein